jgi:hypothetical protein
MSTHGTNEGAAPPHRDVTSFLCAQKPKSLKVKSATCRVLCGRGKLVLATIHPTNTKLFNNCLGGGGGGG